MIPRLQQSITFKVLGIGVLALLMLIPLAQVQGLIFERNGLREKALADIAQRWGAAQDVGGPLLAIPKRRHVRINEVWTAQESTEILLADQLFVEAKMAPQVRKYAIYSTPVYEAEIKMSGRFLGRDVHALGPAASEEPGATDEGFLFDRAELRLPVEDVRGIRRISALRIDGVEYTFGPSTSAAGALRTISLPIDLGKWQDGAHEFKLDLTLAGTESLHFLPLARHTEASMAAPWPSPSFNGAFLPAEHKVNDQGFDAHWQVLDLNRSYGQHWQDESQSRPVDAASAAFGVSLYQPADLYQRNERAGKYGVLFIALTFVAFFLFEVLKQLRVHPVQYLLVGLALTTFYVVLLAFSEQIGFGFAYLFAATTVVLLVGGYAAAVLRARRAGWMLAGTLAFVYALLYGLVVSEQYSLLMGAIALLVVVAALMFLTRKVDWYTYSTVSATPAA
jgi:inner membrane protein